MLAGCFQGSLMNNLEATTASVQIRVVQYLLRLSTMIYPETQGTFRNIRPILSQNIFQKCLLMKKP